MIASLPWYPDPTTREAEARLWDGMRAICDLPPLSTPNDNLTHWRDPAMVLSQTCVWPLVEQLADRVTYVASPDFQLEGCAPGNYRSVVVQRADDPREMANWPALRLAFNDPLSQSGYRSIKDIAHAAAVGFAEEISVGSHAEAIRTIAEGRADIAAIDAHTWRLRQRHDPNIAGLRIAAHTPTHPAPPFITGDAARATELRDALQAAIDSLAQADRDTLGLHGVVDLGAAAYGLRCNSPRLPA